MAAAAVLSGAAQPEPRHAPCVAPAFAAGRQGSGGNRDRFVFVLVNVWADNSIRVLSGHSIRLLQVHTLQLDVELVSWSVEIRPRHRYLYIFFLTLKFFAEFFAPSLGRRPIAS